MDDRALDELRALAQRDRELAARRDELRVLEAAVAELRGRAEKIDAFLAAYRAEEVRLREELAAADEELAQRRAERAEAEAALARAGSEDERRRLESVARRASDHVETTAGRVDRVRADADRLEQKAGALPAEVTSLETDAAAIQPSIGDDLAQPSGPRELAEWASHAHAELFVAARQIDGQRERVIREANELATMLAGEPTYGSTVEQALARVEHR